MQGVGRSMSLQQGQQLTWQVTHSVWHSCVFPVRNSPIEPWQAIGLPAMGKNAKATAKSLEAALTVNLCYGPRLQAPFRQHREFQPARLHSAGWAAVNQLQGLTAACSTAPSSTVSNSLQPVVICTMSPRCSAITEAVVKPMGTTFHAAHTLCVVKQCTGTASNWHEREARAPSVCIFATFASLMPLIAHSSFLVECASDSTVLMPPSFNFFMSDAATPSSCVVHTTFSELRAAQRAQRTRSLHAAYLQLLDGIRPGLLVLFSLHGLDLCLRLRHGLQVVACARCKAVPSKQCAPQSLRSKSKLRPLNTLQLSGFPFRAAEGRTDQDKETS